MLIHTLETINIPYNQDSVDLVSFFLYSMQKVLPNFRFILRFVNRKLNPVHSKTISDVFILLLSFCWGFEYSFSSWKLTDNYKLKWHILWKYRCSSPFKCKNLKIQMRLWFANWHLQAFNELSMRKILKDSHSWVFVPTLALREEAKEIGLFFCGLTHGISFLVIDKVLNYFLRNCLTNPRNILALFIKSTLFFFFTIQPVF